MNSEFDIAAREYQQQVEKLAAGLIRDYGVPPAEALESAKAEVRRRRCERPVKPTITTPFTEE